MEHGTAEVRDFERSDCASPSLIPSFFSLKEQRHPQKFSLESRVLSFRLFNLFNATVHPSSFRLLSLSVGLERLLVLLLFVWLRSGYSPFFLNTLWPWPWMLVPRPLFISVERCLRKGNMSMKHFQNRKNLQKPALAVDFQLSMELSFALPPRFRLPVWQSRCVSSHMQLCFCYYSCGQFLVTRPPMQSTSKLAFRSACKACPHIVLIVKELPDVSVFNTQPDCREKTSRNVQQIFPLAETPCLRFRIKGLCHIVPKQVHSLFL